MFVFSLFFFSFLVGYRKKYFKKFLLTLIIFPNEIIKNFRNVYLVCCDTASNFFSICEINEYQLFHLALAKYD